MTVFINARFLCQPLSGVQRFSGEILNALDRLMDDDPMLKAALEPVIALRPVGESRTARWNNISLRRVGTTQGHVWEQGALHTASKTGILVSLGNVGPLRHPAQILALHDANIWDIPQAFSSRYRLLHKTIRPVLARRAMGLITVSHFSAARLSYHLGVPQQRFKVIPNGADHILRVPAESGALERFSLAKNGYLLSVGNQSPNKNISRLIEAHLRAGPNLPPLVIVGGDANGTERQVQHSTQRVHLLGRVDDATLRCLYANALGFIFPSLYEGFGIPPLEAMLLGTPVMAAKRSALPEVLQDGALWFDPTDVDRMARALNQFATLPAAALADLKRRGTKIARQFTWEQSAWLLAAEILSLKARQSSDGRAAQRSEIKPTHKAS
jgi:glycosyltransferase involved in cell wall biosynthesis